MKYVLSILAMIAGFVLAHPACADDLVVSRAVLEDAAGTLTISDMPGSEFKPTGPMLSKSFTDSAHWLRLRVRAPEKGSEVVLFIRQPYLNEIRLYEADAGHPSEWKTRVTGNHYPYGERDIARSTLGFVVNVTSPEATYYLRVNTIAQSHFSVEALTPDEAEHKNDQFDLLEMFFVTAMLSLLLWALQSYLLERQQAVKLFAIHQAVYTLYGMSVMGYLAPWIPAGLPQMADWAIAIPYCGVGFTILLFCRALFKPYDPPPLMMRGLKLFMWAFPLELAAIALGHTIFAVIVNAVLLRAMWWYFVIMTFTLRKEHSPRRFLLQVFFITITLIFSVFWLSYYSSQVSAISYMGRQILIANGLIMGGLFAMVLHARARRLQRHAQQAALDLLQVQQKFELEQKLREQAEVQSRTDYLTGLFNRRHFIELAERELARSIRYRRPLTLLMIDIDHYKAINDTWGHNAGDVVLQDVAQLIRATLRNVDIIGRIGGEEFAALLLETEGEHAKEVAQRLCAAVAENAVVLREVARVQVTISIGLTELNGREISFDSLMNEADQAMYGAKQSGRNRVMICEPEAASREPVSAAAEAAAS
jgi:diguanylate cyclase (GGDEF)-like protein